jgi:hypothetical protein
MSSLPIQAAEKSQRTELIVRQRAIRSSWSSKERQLRRKAAALQQQRLIEMLQCHLPRVAC